jgi:hypothetical protein
VTRRGGVRYGDRACASVKLTLGEPAASRGSKSSKRPPKRLIDKLDVKPDRQGWLLRAVIA